MAKEIVGISEEVFSTGWCRVVHTDMDCIKGSIADAVPHFLRDLCDLFSECKSVGRTRSGSEDLSQKSSVRVCVSFIVQKHILDGSVDGRADLSHL